MKKILKSLYIITLIFVMSLPNIPASAASARQHLDTIQKPPLPVLQKGNGNNKNDPYYSVTQKWILIGDTRTLYLYNIANNMEVTCKSSDSSILKVNYDGSKCRFTGVSAGNAVVTITIKEAGSILFKPTKYKLTCKINVSPRAASVKFRQSSCKVNAGKKKKLEVILRPSITKEKPVYESSNTKIAMVSPSGLVKAKTSGTCYITATISNGKSTRCKIIVQKVKKKKNK